MLVCVQQQSLVGAVESLTDYGGRAVDLRSRRRRDASSTDSSIAIDRPASHFSARPLSPPQLLPECGQPQRPADMTSQPPPPAAASAAANTRSSSGLDSIQLDLASLSVLVPHITNSLAAATIATLAESAYFTVGQLRRRADTTAGFTGLGLLPGIVDAFDIYCQPQPHPLRARLSVCLLVACQTDR